MIQSSNDNTFFFVLNKTTNRTVDKSGDYFVTITMIFLHPSLLFPLYYCIVITITEELPQNSPQSRRN